MPSEIHVSDVGTAFTITVKDEDDAVVDISSASTLQIIFKKPDGSTLVKTATLSGDGTDGKMEYTTVSGDLDDDGTWEIQGFVDLGSTSFYTNISTFKVYRNLT